MGDSVGLCVECEVWDGAGGSVYCDYDCVFDVGGGQRHSVQEGKVEDEAGLGSGGVAANMRTPRGKTAVSKASSREFGQVCGCS